MFSNSLRPSSAAWYRYFTTRIHQWVLTAWNTYHIEQSSRIFNSKASISDRLEKSSRQSLNSPIYDGKTHAKWLLPSLKIDVGFQQMENTNLPQISAVYDRVKEIVISNVS